MQGPTERTARLTTQRTRMVESDLRRRGILDEGVLDAMASVPREKFLPAEMAEFAYEDHPLPIEAGQTISQPYIVALMAQAMHIDPRSRVLEVGTGSGYGAAVLSRVAEKVVSIERHEGLADRARENLASAGCDNVTVVHGDGMLGFPDAAPYDAIVVTTSGTTVPESLLEQLADGGRLVIPIGPDTRGQALLRITRAGNEFHEEDLGAVRLVPFVGTEARDSPGSPSAVHRRIDAVPSARRSDVASLVRSAASPFGTMAEAPMEELLERIGDSQMVLLGEASHGTSEFYRMRDLITRELIRHKGFTAVAVEADWPDAARVDAHVRRRETDEAGFEAFTRFPTWMWRNRDVATHISWLHEHNRDLEPERQVSFHGLDLYSMFTSRDEVLRYLDRVDPAAGVIARRRYSCLTPWQHDPAEYGRAVTTGAFVGCEEEVAATLTDLLKQRFAYADDDAYIEAAQNAAVVLNAERYYRIMYRGSRESWNLRDQHMFETLKLVRSHRGPDTRVVVWEHNSHIGDASATEMGVRGEQNVGMLSRHEFGDDAFLIGFGTDHGTVAAATDWGGPMHRKTIRPSHPESYERICHDSEIPAFILHLRRPKHPDLREELSQPRLERAIGVIYRPETELQSHYFQAVLARQFDSYIWFDESRAVTPIAGSQSTGIPDTWPFGL